MIIKVPLSWLREYCDIPWPAEELAHRLTMAGLEVDSMERVGASFEGVVVGEVLTVEKHPNADRLSRCAVRIGAQTLDIVCGAPNVAAGQRVPVALVGTRLPNGLEIKQARIRGVTSNGMICSEAELGLSDAADGIMVLPPDAPVGQPLRAVLGDPETVLGIDVGTNRPDCLSIVGVAREVAALTRGALRLPDDAVPETGPPVEGEASVTVHAPEDCPRFAGRVIKGITVGPSPPWMVRRLEAAGLRAINNVVDVTNYVMLELGQPLHAYDLDELAGHAVIVRRAGADERFTTLDGEERALSPEVLMITDRDRGIGVAGVMGGLNTEITEKTAHVFLEGACFDAARVRRGAKILHLSTDASRRFERGMDPALQGYAVNRAARLIQEVAGGTIAAGRIDVRAPLPPPESIRLRVDRVNGLLGTAIPKQEVQALLEALHFELAAEGGDLRVRVPSFRRDIVREVDLIEEVARLYGYDRIEPTISRPTPPDLNEGADAPRIQREARQRWKEDVSRRVRDTLVGQGFIEVTTHSFVHPDQNRLVSPDRDMLIVENPLSPDLSAMRTCLAASVLSVVRWNSNRKVRHIRIFEIGRVFWPQPGQPLPGEPVQLCIAMTGQRAAPHWSDQSAPLDFFDAKGIMELVLERFALDKVRSVAYDGTGALFHPGQAASLIVDNRCIGAYGAVSQTTLERYDLREPVWMGLLDVDYLQELTPSHRMYRALPRFPAVERDLAILVPDAVDHQAITEAIRSRCGALLEEIALFDIYRGQQVPAGKKSMAFALRFRSDERTLTDEEVSALQQRALDHLKALYGAELRS
jgi:phenylalanyl-tRNA synthetase beta chain